MTRNTCLILFIFLTFTAPGASAPERLPAVQGNDTLRKGISQEETILFNLVNDMRLQNKLPVIPFSDKLGMVARVHIQDILVMKPYEQGCGLHSWSASGNRTPCCYAKDPEGISCMKRKPAELTGYAGNGYELIYSGDDRATPVDAARLWKQVEASADMILSRGKWKEFTWQAMGVGIGGNYALLWLGDKPDDGRTQDGIAADPDAVKIAADAPTQTQPETAARYYLVVGSLKTSAAAKAELKKVKAKGYPGAVILDSGTIYRIAAEAFDTEPEAKTRLNQLKNKFPGIWIYRK